MRTASPGIMEIQCLRQLRSGPFECVSRSGLRRSRCSFSFSLLKDSWKHDKIKRCHIHFALTHERCNLYGCGINARTRAKAIAPVHMNHPYVYSPVAPLTVLITIVMTAPVAAPLFWPIRSLRRLPQNRAVSFLPLEMPPYRRVWRLHKGGTIARGKVTAHIRLLPIPSQHLSNS